MKRWIWPITTVLVLLGAALAGLGLREVLFPDEGKIWNSLENSLGKLADPPGGSFSSKFWKTYERDDNNFIGHVGFADGRTWRFAFRSHHMMQGTDSFTLFRGDGETWWLKGSYFCCEIFSAEDQPRNAEEFRDLLKRAGDVLEKLP